MWRRCGNVATALLPSAKNITHHRLAVSVAVAVGVVADADALNGALARCFYFWEFGPESSGRDRTL